MTETQLIDMDHLEVAIFLEIDLLKCYIFIVLSDCQDTFMFSPSARPHVCVPHTVIVLTSRVTLCL